MPWLSQTNKKEDGIHDHHHPPGFPWENQLSDQCLQSTTNILVQKYPFTQNHQQ